MIQNEYEINSKTNAIIGISKKGSIILEGEREIYSTHIPQEIIERNCEYGGSTFNGRLKNSQLHLGKKYKLPIVISEIKETVMFPTKSYYDDTCCWISLNNIVKYEEVDKKVCIYFKEGKPQIFDISLETLEIGVLRASKLLLILKIRKKDEF